MRKLRSKITKIQALTKRLRQSSKKNKTVVFTNGCFDLLHPGHVHYLERARSLGDILVVALNTDASVRRLKGPSRPLNSLEDRMRVIAALESVDFVIAFDDDTPLDTILRLQPNLIVKGGDWKISDIVGAREALSWGGKAKSLPFITGKSTTSLIARARKK